MADSQQDDPPSKTVPQESNAQAMGTPQEGVPVTVPQEGFPVHDSLTKEGSTKGLSTFSTVVPIEIPCQSDTTSTVGYKYRGTVNCCGDVYDDDFVEMCIWKGFIKKVYAILLSQLLVTLAFFCLFNFQEQSIQFVVTNQIIILILVGGVLLVIVIVMMLCEEIRRQAPWNLILFGAYTLSVSVLLGIFSNDNPPMIMAVGVTAAICLAVTLFAMQTRFHLTSIAAGIYCTLVAATIFGLCTIFIHADKTSIMLGPCFGALLYSLFLIYKTQQMVDGKDGYSISPEEYMFGALNLYVDIFKIFFYILILVIFRRSRLARCIYGNA